MGAVYNPLRHGGCLQSATSWELSTIRYVMGAVYNPLRHGGCLQSAASWGLSTILYIMGAVYNPLHHGGCLQSSTSWGLPNFAHGLRCLPLAHNSPNRTHRGRFPLQNQRTYFAVTAAFHLACLSNKRWIGSRHWSETRDKPSGMVGRLCGCGFAELGDRVKATFRNRADFHKETATTKVDFFLQVWGRHSPVCLQEAKFRCVCTLCQKGCIQTNPKPLSL